MSVQISRSSQSHKHYLGYIVISQGLFVLASGICESDAPVLVLLYMMQICPFRLALEAQAPTALWMQGGSLVNRIIGYLGAHFALSMQISHLSFDHQSRVRQSIRHHSTSRRYEICLGIWHACS